MKHKNFFTKNFIKNIIFIFVIFLFSFLNSHSFAQNKNEGEACTVLAGDKTKTECISGYYCKSTSGVVGSAGVCTIVSRVDSGGVNSGAGGGAGASGDIVGGQAVQSLDNLSNGGRGIIPCDTGANPEKCSPKYLVNLVKTLGQVFIYLIVIALVLTLIISGVGYVYYGKNPGYLLKIKKYISNAFYALLAIMLVFGVVLGLLAAVGFNDQVLNFLKDILAFNPSDIHFFQTAIAQNVPVLDTGSSTNYINFFPKQTIGSLLLLTIRFLVNYIAAPALVIGVIYTGFLFVKAQGNPKELDEAKKFAKRVLIGIAIAASATLVVNIALNTVNDVAKSLVGGISNKSTNNTIQNPEVFNEGEAQVDPNLVKTAGTSTNNTNNTNTPNGDNLPAVRSQSYADEILDIKEAHDLAGNISSLSIKVKPGVGSWQIKDPSELSFDVTADNKNVTSGNTQFDLGYVSKDGQSLYMEAEDILAFFKEDIVGSKSFLIKGRFEIYVYDKNISNKQGDVIKYISFFIKSN
ncbi:MAG: hypothetical protein RI945_261 [Candidatus Parcubacteria bacterium]